MFNWLSFLNHVIIDHFVCRHVGYWTCEHGNQFDVGICPDGTREMVFSSKWTYARDEIRCDCGK